jgi:hypothetical protein
LLHEFKTLGKFLEAGPSDSSSKEALTMQNFLKDHQTILVLILSLVAGSRLTKPDPKTHEGTIRGEEFEEAVAAISGILARHSAHVNEWCETRKGLEG